MDWGKIALIIFLTGIGASSLIRVVAAFLGTEKNTKPRIVSDVLSVVCCVLLILDGVGVI